MRRKGIIFIVVLAGMVIALSFIFTDKWLEKRLENAGTAIIGARVEIDGLDFSLLGLHIRWDSLQATNPKNTMKNMLTTGRTDFDLQLYPLLSKKVIIDDITVVNVTSGTDRSADGKIEKKKKRTGTTPNFITKTINRLQENVSEAPVWKPDELADLNVDSILQKLRVTSPQKMDSLQKVLAMTYDVWDSAFTVVTWKEDFAYLDSRLNAIKPDDIQTLEGLQTAYKTLEKVYARVDSLEKYVTKTRTHLSSDLQDAAAKVQLVDQWIKDDYENALAQAKLPNINKESIARFIFGGKVTAQAAQVLSAINAMRRFSEKFTSDKPKKEKPPRFKGQTIYFTSNQRLPDFWIKNIKLSGHTSRGLSVDGRIRNIVSNQNLIGKPTTLAVNGKRGDGAHLNFSGELNYLGEAPRENFSLKMGAVPLNNVHLSDSPLLPDKVSSGRGDMQASLDVGGRELSGRLAFSARDLKFDFGDSTSDRVSQIMRRIVQSAKSIEFTAELKSSDERTDFSVQSNLDDLFVQELNAIVGEQVRQARTRIESKVTEQVAPVREKFDAYVDEKTAYLESEMQKYEDLLNKQKELVQSKKKQLEVRIEEEKKKAAKGLQNEAKKKLKGLFDN